MTQEDKQLLLTDLCARLPYGVIIQEYNEEYGYADNALNTIGIGYFSIHEACIEGTWINHIENVRPYLRPMSSMTEEEKEELKDICTMYDCDMGSDWESFGLRIFDISNYGTAFKTDYVAIDWLNKHHFDYRGLISKGLALEATEGMYGKEE